MSAYDAFEWDDTIMRSQGQADTRPAPTFLETAAAGFRFARDDQIGHTDEERQTAYGPVVTALKERGYDPRRYVNPYGAQPVNYDAVWRDIAAARKADPEAFKEIGDRATFESGWRTRFAERQARDANTMQRGSFAGTLAGGLVGSLTDPVNVGGMVLTGGVAEWVAGTHIAGRILTEGAINAGIELLETPLTAVERAKQGRELTAEEIAMNLGFAAAGGAAFKGLEIGAPRALAAGGRAAGRAGEWTLDKLPPDLQAAITLRRAKPDFAMTPDEMAALHIVARGTEIDATNPFAHTYEGLEAHAARIDQTIASMARWPEAAAVQALAPAARRAAAPSGVSTDFATAWRAIIGIEGGTNRDGSFRTSPAGAIGPAQVMPGTAPEAARLAGLPFDERRYRTDAAYNEALGQAYYREMLRQFDGDAEKAAAAYNAGPGSARKGTGVRGAMERARRAGVPNDWVSFLPAETRAYVANFRRRTGGQAGDVIELADGEVIAPARPAALDAERPLVERSDFEIAQDRSSPDLPELRRDLFASDEDWRVAQAHVDAEAFGVEPASTAIVGQKRGDFHEFLGEDARTISAALSLPLLKDRQTGRDMVGIPEHAFDGWREDLAQQGIAIDRAVPVTADVLRSNSVPVRVSDFAKDQSSVQRGFLIAPDGKLHQLADGFEHADFGKAIPARDAAEFAALTSYGGEVALRPAARPTPAQARAIARIRKAVEREGGAFTEGGLTGEVRPAYPDVVASPAIRDEIEAAGGTGPAVIDESAGKAFDDPTGDPVARVADLAWHDAQRAAATREAPEQLTFDLGDGKGERTIADIEAELKADEDAIATIESCLLPAAPAAGGAA